MSQIRALIDTHFSLQWCRENIVAPLGLEKDEITGSQRLTVAIGNFSYLATIGDFIKQRAKNAGLECQFIENLLMKFNYSIKRPEKVTGESNALDGIEFSDDAVLDALKGVDDEAGTQGFDFDFDDSDEQIIEEQALELSTEMLSKIQQAAAKILIQLRDQGF